MNEAATIAEALAQIPEAATVTRGWPVQTARLPCIAVGLSEQTTADTRDNVAYLTRQVYGIRIFAAVMGDCDALAERVAGVMETLGYTLENTLEIDGATAQQQMTFQKLR